jgi:hypothetical protein
MEIICHSQNRNIFSQMKAVATLKIKIFSAKWTQSPFSKSKYFQPNGRRRHSQNRNIFSQMEAVATLKIEIF